MSKMFKIIAGALGLIGLFMMFLPQVSLHLQSGVNQTVGVGAFFGGTIGSGAETTDINTIKAGFAGYILLGVGGLLLLLCGLLRFFQEHDVVNYIATGVALICLIVGIVMIFLIRKDFMETNGLLSKEVYVGIGAMIGGSLGGLSIAVGGLGLILDFAK